MLFNPSVNEVRQFFVTAWRKQQQGEVMTPLESMVADIVVRHPEYHAWLEAEDALVKKAPEGMQPPFLHLSLHLALEEQLSIDHPPGIRACWEQLCRTREPHDAKHIMMGCLAEMVEHAQRTGHWPDTEEYLERIRRLP